MKVLITGSTGFIGKYVIDTLLNFENIDIIVTSSNENKLNDLQSREGKLIQLYKYISEYHDLLRLKGPQTDSALILSIDNLKKFIDLYKEKQSKVLQKQLQSTSLMEAVTTVL